MAGSSQQHQTGAWVLTGFLIALLGTSSLNCNTQLATRATPSSTQASITNGAVSSELPFDPNV